VFHGASAQGEVLSAMVACLECMFSLCSSN